jgi:hypothetical protein
MTMIEFWVNSSRRPWRGGSGMHGVGAHIFEMMRMRWIYDKG